MILVRYAYSLQIKQIDYLTDFGKIHVYSRNMNDQNLRTTILSIIDTSNICGLTSFCMCLWPTYCRKAISDWVSSMESTTRPIPSITIIAWCCRFSSSTINFCPVSFLLTILGNKCKISDSNVRRKLKYNMDKIRWYIF